MLSIAQSSMCDNIIVDAPIFDESQDDDVIDDLIFVYSKIMMLILHQSLMCIQMVMLIVLPLNPDACFNVESY